MAAYHRIKDDDMTQVRRDEASPRREPFIQVITALVAMIEERDARIDVLQEQIAVLEVDNERLQEQYDCTAYRLTLTEESWRSYREYREHLEDIARRM